MRGIVSLICFTCLTTVSLGQNLYNESVISIGPASVLYVKDTIINQGTIVNNGDMQVGGSWINNADYDAGEGKITFNSDLPQIINHNDQSFSRLTLSGGGEKLFLADITVENELNLIDGILVSENDSRIVITPSAQVTGGSDAAHIRGPVYHRGSGHKVFPVGDGSRYLPVEFLNIEGASAEIGVTLVENSGEALLTSPSVTAVSANRYWQIDAVSGSVANSLVVLPVRDEHIFEADSKIVVAESASVNEPFESLGQSSFEGSTTNGWITSEKTVTKSLLAIGTGRTEEGLVVYNFVSPNEDGQNDFLIIANIENFPENRFTLFNRWGDKVFELDNYDNKERVFRGKTNVGGEQDLSSGTYFYTLETKADGKKTTGFLVVRN